MNEMCKLTHLLIVGFPPTLQIVFIIWPCIFVFTSRTVSLVAVNYGYYEH